VPIASAPPPPLEEPPLLPPPELPAQPVGGGPIPGPQVLPYPVQSCSLRLKSSLYSTTSSSSASLLPPEITENPWPDGILDEEVLYRSQSRAEVVVPESAALAATPVMPVMSLSKITSHSTSSVVGFVKIA
jgi:hypothetical protein